MYEREIYSKNLGDIKSKLGLKPFLSGSFKFQNEMPMSLFLCSKPFFSLQLIVVSSFNLMTFLLSPILIVSPCDHQYRMN